MAAKVSLTQALRDEYAQLFALARIRPENAFEVDAGVARISDPNSRAIYERLEAKSGVPWYVIGIIHGLECNWSFRKHLHNGDPLTARTVQVPSGRPKTGSPPFEFEVSALDALTEQRGAGANSDWSIPGICYMFESYNGFGYRLFHPHVKSPYLWSYTTIYTTGKYVQDGKWSETTKSRQCGAMALLRRLVDKGIVSLEVAAVAESPPSEAPSDLRIDADVAALMKPSSPPPFPGVILKKDRGTVEQVKLLQNRLLALGITAVGKADGDFGDNTANAVKLFQARAVDEAGNPLEVDGVVGPRTWRALFGQPSAEEFPDLTPAAGSLSAEVVRIAGTQVGVREQPLGSNRGPEVDAYLDRVDPGLRGNAWCVAFLYWCHDEAASRHGKANPMPRTAGVHRHWQLAPGAPGSLVVSAAEAASDPTLVRPGMIFHIDTGGGLGHAGLVVDVQGQTLVTVEGNTSDGGSREGIGVFIRRSRRIGQINLGFVGHAWA